MGYSQLKEKKSNGINMKEQVKKRNTKKRIYEGEVILGKKQEGLLIIQQKLNKQVHKYTNKRKKIAHINVTSKYNRKKLKTKDQKGQKDILR